MTTRFSTLIAAVLTFTTTQAQLTNGSIAPDFTLSDINGTQHQLYTYLDAGKTVYIDFFAAHCPTCWNYKNAGHLSNLYTTYGPSGSDEVVVIAIELDPNNGSNELNGISGWTQGDWVTPTPYPIINPEGAQRSNIIAAYAANYYPLIYGICPDRKVKVVGTGTTAALYSYHTSECAALGIGEPETNPLFAPAGTTLELLTDGQLSITDFSGRVVFNGPVAASGVFSLTDFPAGVYLIRMENNGQFQTTRLLVP